jgi:hypothetical protein
MKKIASKRKTSLFLKAKRHFKALQKKHPNLHIHASVTAAVAAVLILAQVFTYPNLGSAATYNFTQTSWGGGVSVSSGVHPTNQSDWNSYSSAASVVAGAGGITLSTGAQTITQTSDADANAGFNLTGNSASQTAVTGTGDSASVVLGTTGTNYTITQTDNSATTATVGTQGGWDNRGVSPYSAVTGMSSVKRNATVGDGSSVQLTASIKTAIFITQDNGSNETTYTGNLGGRSGADATCSAHPKKPASAYNVHAFLSVNGSSRIQDLPTLYGYTSANPVYWYRSTNGAYTLLANSWTDMLDGAIPTSAQTGTGATNSMRTGATASGGLSSSNCVGWTSGQSTTTGAIGFVAYTNSQWLAGFNSACNSSYALACMFNIDEATYNSSGTYTTYIDAGAASAYTWNTLSWLQTANSGSISVKAKTSATTALPSFATSTCDSSSSGSSGSVTMTDSCRGSSHRYVWYQFTLNAGSGNTTTPTLDQVQASVDKNVYQSSGTYTSGPIDLGFNTSAWGNLSWTATGGQTITMKARSSATSNFSGATDWASCSNITSGSALSTGSCVTNNQRYIQYQASLSTSDTSATPSLDSVVIGYTGYAASGNLVSSAYDSADSANVVGGMGWTQDSSLPDGTGVAFSIRAAADSAGLAAAPWNDLTATSTGCSASSGVVSCDSSAVPVGLKDGLGDRWIQYKITLTSAGETTPTVTSATMTYVVNAPPQLEAGRTTASQIATSSDPNWGKIEINYSVRDTDTGLGTNTPGYVTPSFEYNIGAGWVAISSSTLSAGAATQKAVDATSYTPYTAYWNASEQIPGTYNASFTVRVTANDNEAANNTAQAVSAATTIDMNAPASVSVSINSATDTFVLQATDESFLEYRVSSVAELPSEWQSAGASTLNQTLSGLTLVAGENGTESIYGEVRDAYGNSAVFQAAAPGAPSNFDLRDISNESIGQYREFLSWRLYSGTDLAGFESYKLYRSTDNSNFSLLTTITDVNTNFYMDTAVSAANTYYYKILVIDTDGDQSAYSPVVSDIPNGQGGTDFTAPIIENVEVAEVQPTWARITWTTDEISDSEVDYSEDTSYGNTESNSALVTEHSIVLSDLVPGTTYKFRVRSEDILNNVATDDNGGAGYEVEAPQGPRISDVVTESVADRQATISWNTDVASNSFVVYSDDVTDLVSGGTEVGDAAAVSGPPYQHRVTLTGLQPSITYYYYVRSTDLDTNMASVDRNGDDYYSFSTGNDSKPPVISGVSTPILTPNAVVILWTTDELADSQAIYGTESGTLSQDTDLDRTLSIYHTAQLTGLTESTDYFYRVQSTDANDNSASSEELSFATTNGVTVLNVITSSGGAGDSGSDSDTTAPLVSDIQVADIGAFGATVNFTTSEMTTAAVDINDGNTAMKSFASFEPATSHSIKLFGLKPGTDYDAIVSAQDGNGNFSEEQHGNKFRTNFVAEGLEDLKSIENADQLQSELESLIESVLPSLVPPYIGAVTVKDISDTSATIGWSTNVKSYGSIGFVEEAGYKPAAANPYISEASDPDGRVNAHEVTLTNLTPGTRYHFKAKSFVFPGVVGSGQDMVFSTKLGQVDVQVTSITNEGFNVSWSTSQQTSSAVEYRNLKTNAVGQTGSDDLTTKHIVEVKNLDSDTTYRVRVFGRDANGDVVEGNPTTVTTKSDKIAPIVSAISINSAFVPYRNDQLQTVLSWKTNEPSNSVVTFEEGVGKNETLANKAGQEDEYVLQHAVVLSSLKPNTIYRVKISSSDKSGNEGATPIRTIITPAASESVFDIMIKNFEGTFDFLQKLR